MSRDEIKDVILEIIEDIDEEADWRLAEHYIETGI